MRFHVYFAEQHNFFGFLYYMLWVGVWFMLCTHQTGELSMRLSSLHQDLAYLAGQS